MGNDTSRNSVSPIDISVEDESSALPMEHYKISMDELAREWRIHWQHELKSLTVDQQTKIKNAKPSHQWFHLVKHHRDTAARFVDDSMVFYSSSHRLDIAEALLTTALYLFEKLPHPEAQKESNLRKEVLAVKSRLRDLQEKIKSEAMEGSIKGSTRLNMPQDVFIVDGFKTFLSKSRILDRFGRELTSHLSMQQKWLLYEYLQFLNSALAAQLYGDDAFQCESFNASVHFYRVAVELYPSLTLNDALRAALEESSAPDDDVEENPLLGSIGRIRRRSSLPGQSFAFSAEEKEKIITKFNIIILSKEFPDLLKRKLLTMDLFRKRDLCEYFELTFEGPTFSATTDELLGTKNLKVEKAGTQKISRGINRIYKPFFAPTVKAQKSDKKPTSPQKSLEEEGNLKKKEVGKLEEKPTPKITEDLKDEVKVEKDTKRPNIKQLVAAMESKGAPLPFGKMAPLPKSVIRKTQQAWDYNQEENLAIPRLAQDDKQKPTGDDPLEHATLSRPTIKNKRRPRSKLNGPSKDAELLPIENTAS